MNAILEHWKENTATLTPSAAKVVNLLGGNPVVTAKKVSETLSIAYNTANRSLVALEKAEILFPVNDAMRDRVFVARELLNILEEPVRFGGYQIRKEKQEAEPGQHYKDLNCKIQPLSPNTPLNEKSNSRRENYNH